MYDQRLPLHLQLIFLPDSYPLRLRVGFLFAILCIADQTRRLERH